MKTKIKEIKEIKEMKKMTEMKITSARTYQITRMKK